MANSNFVVHNGLTVGPLSIDAATGNIASSTGNITINANLFAASLNSTVTNQLTLTDPLVYLVTDHAYPYDFDTGVFTHFVGGPANVYAHTGMARSKDNNYWGFFSNVKTEPTGTINWSDAGLIWDPIKAGDLTLANTTVSSSTTTGALKVAGGVGVAKNLYVGGDSGVAIVHTGNIIPSANGTMNLGSTSAWYGTLYGISTQAKYADLAENYEADSAYPYGTVLMFGGAQEVTVATAETKAVAGVVSQNPAHLMNGQLTGANVVPLALTGRVPCNVIGPIKKGDLLVSAGFGYAKTNNNAQAGQIIGKALADFTGAKGQIEVVVGRF